MLKLTPDTRIFMAVAPVDMRRSFSGLCATIAETLGASPMGGDLFLFRGKRADRVKALILRCSASDRGGTAEFASRLIGKRGVTRQVRSESEPRLFSKAARSRAIREQQGTEDAVMASEIEQLPDLSGYLKLASGPQWRMVFLG